jgi:hypothetical protein
MKILRVFRAIGIVALILFSVLGLGWRAGLSDKGLAAYQGQIKKADVSVSIEQEGHVIKVAGIQAPGQAVKPCSATLVFESSSR